MTGRQRIRFVVFAAVAMTGGWLVSPAAQQAAGRPLAIEDYYRIKTVGGPSFSPDSGWLLFTASTRVEENNGNRTETYVVPVTGASAARRIEHDGQDVGGATWTDDNRVRYSVNNQVWSIDPANPSAPPTKVEGATPGGGGRGRGGAGGGGRAGGAGAGGGGGASIPSPDRAWTAALADRPEKAPAPPALTEFAKRHEERFKGTTFDWMEFQRDGQPFPAPNPSARPAQRIVVRPAGGGEPRTLVDEDMRPTGLIWHPSGKLLAFTSDPVWRDETKYDRPDLYLVTVDGKLTRLTNDGYVHGDLDFSPDGKYLSYARSFGTDMIIEQKLNHGGPRDLFIRPVDGGQPINLTAKWDLEPGASTWSPDSRFIYFTTGIGGESHLFRVSVPQGQIEQITKGERRINGLTFDRKFQRIAYTVGLHETPGDVYVANIDGSGEKRLSDIHAPFRAEVALSKADRLRWKSYDGAEIEGWLTYPHGYDRSRGPYPLIVFSHGGPHAATGYSFDFKKQFFAANGYFVLDTNFRSSTGYGDAFKWATWGEWGKKDGEDVMSGIDHVLKTYPIDPSRVGHTGHSYGGFMTNWLITQYPDRFAAAVSGAGISNWISDYGTADIFRTKETEFFGPPWDAAARDRMIKQSPITFAGKVRTPTLFVHGERDQRVPYEEAEQMYFALKRRGIPARMIIYEGQPHGIGGHWNNVHRMLNELRWWETYLKGGRR